MSEELVRLKNSKVYHRVTARWGYDGKVRETACGVWGNPGRLRDCLPSNKEHLRPCRKCFPEGARDEQPS